MDLVFFSIIIAWLYIFHLALGVVVSKYINNFALAKVSSLFFIVTVVFFIEHFYGLGENLSFLAPVIFFVSLYLIYRRFIRLEHHYTPSSFNLFIKDLLIKDWPFIFGFLFALYWRILYPDINQSTERITDLYFITNYARGETLPPLNLWYPPYRFDFYYSFQHYAAALLGRVLNLNPGWTYNLCFALFFGYMASLVYESTKKYTQSAWFSFLLLCTVLIGGTGISVIFDFIRTPGTTDNSIIASMRFIGTTELNTTLAPYFASTSREVQNVPVETFGYLLFIGDYHPPLSAYTLLMIWLSTFMLWRTEDNGKIIPILLGFCVPFALVSSVWVFPLMIISCVIYLFYSKKVADWRLIIIGAAIATFLLFPYLNHLFQGALGATIKITPFSQYSPILLLFLQFWPVYIPVLLLLFVRHNKKLAIFFFINFIILMVFTEAFYVEDGAVEIFNRTNSTMKWWGWLFIIGQVPAAWLVFKNNVKWQKIVLCTVLLVPTVAHFYLLLPYLKPNNTMSIKALSGDNWLRHDNQINALMKYLTVLPDGIVLEYVKEDFYTTSPALTMFVKKPAFIGWHNHLWTWGLGSKDLMDRNDMHRKFYQGELKNTTQWLLENNISYIVWKPEDGTVDDFNKVSQSIDPAQYVWHSFTLDDNKPLGVWVKNTSSYVTQQHSPTTPLKQYILDIPN